MAVVSLVTNVLQAARIASLTREQNSRIQKQKEIAEARSNLLAKFEDLRKSLDPLEETFDVEWEHFGEDLDRLVEPYKRDSEISKIIKRHMDSYRKERAHFPVPSQVRLDSLRKELGELYDSLFSSDGGDARTSLQTRANYLRKGEVFCVEYLMNIDSQISLLTAPAFESNVT